MYRTITLYGPTFQEVPLEDWFRIAVLQPRHSRNCYGLGSSPFDRLYLGNHYCFIFLRVLRCFSSPGLLPVTRIPDLQSGGLPHSEISGSKVVCTSPKLIAAYHVLHRLWEPRHSPYALNYFLSIYSFVNEIHCCISNNKDIMTIFRLIIVFSFNMSKNGWVC